MDKTIFIYKIINKQTNEIYIGQSIHPFQRWKEHYKQLTAAKTQKELIFNYIFEIIAITNEINANEVEQYWIEFYNAVEQEMNSRNQVMKKQNHRILLKSYLNVRITKKEREEIIELLKLCKIKCKYNNMKKILIELGYEVEEIRINGYRMFKFK